MIRRELALGRVSPVGRPNNCSISLSPLGPGQVLGIRGLRAFGTASPDLVNCQPPNHLPPSPSQVPRAPRSRRL